VVAIKYSTLALLPEGSTETEAISSYVKVFVELPVISLVESIKVPPAANEKFNNSVDDETFKFKGTVVE
tara:strand:- start:22 stop:228 length:207 start_codon:yes stop_codon:yes gene_type:complete